MSQHLLDLKIFTNLDALFHSTKFRDPNVFSYIGKPLERWIVELLNSFGVGSEPLVHGNVEKGAILKGSVFIDKGAVVESTAMITGPCYIGPGTEVRHGAYLRGCVYAGKECVIGHTTEVKGSLFLDGAKAGHFAYVGDSILGQNTNLGAGTKLANLKFKADEVVFSHPVTGMREKSGLRKFGAVVGDFAQTGCNSVLSPGTLLLPHVAVMSCEHFQGTLKSGIYRGKHG